MADVALTESFHRFNELLDGAHAWLLGQRARFIAEGFSETAAEQMCVELWAAYVGKLFA